MGSLDAVADEINVRKNDGAGRDLIGAHLAMILSGKRKFQLWLKREALYVAASLGWNPLTPIEKASTYSFLLREDDDFTFEKYTAFFKKTFLSDEDKAAIERELLLNSKD